MIVAEKMSFSYGKHEVLHDISLQIADGAFVLISGPSGSGKSTLARTFNGLAFQTQRGGKMTGALHVDGLNVRQQEISALATRVGMIFQIPATQLFNLRVEEEIAFGPHNLGWNETKIQRQVGWAMEAVGITHLRQREVRTLSGGEKQRLAIASVLSMGPRHLVLDEPTAALDIPGTQQVLSTLTDLNQKEGRTIVIIEHRLGEVAPHAKWAILLQNGHVAAQGETDSLLGNRTLRRQLGLRRLTDEPQHNWQELLVPTEPPNTNPLISCHHVTGGYQKGQPIIKDVSFQLHQGEFVALVGNNGSGKSTIARYLAGSLRPWTGEIEFAWGPKHAREGGQVALLMQNPLQQLFCERVDEEVRFGPQNFRQLDETLVQRVLEILDLTALTRRPLFALSRGQQQRVALASLLTLSPRLLILDEPTMGQDWGHLSRFMGYLQTLNAQGLTILLITHDYKLVHRYAHRVLLLDQGRIILEGKPQIAVQKTAENAPYPPTLGGTHPPELEAGDNNSAQRLKVTATPAKSPYGN